jgi:proline dehydrogenase
MSWINRAIAAALPAVPRPLVRHFSRPYIAGETLEDMTRVVAALNREGLLGTVDVLGEFITRAEQAETAVADYQRVLSVLAERELSSGISVKLTALGLKLDKELCYQNLRRVVAFAGEQSRFVRIDMEDSSCTSDTLELYFRLRGEWDNLGVVLQAALRRSLADAKRLAKAKASVRVCKGIYLEPRSIAYQDREIINRNYVLLLETLLEAGSTVAVATHDERLVWEAFRLLDRYGKSSHEFQMLLGVDEPLRRIIRAAGHRLRVYVPFGPKWYAYSVRRLRENPQVAGYVLRNLFPR